MSHPNLVLLCLRYVLLVIQTFDCAFLCAECFCEPSSIQSTSVFTECFCNASKSYERLFIYTACVYVSKMHRKSVFLRNNHSFDFVFRTNVST